MPAALRLTVALSLFSMVLGVAVFASRRDPPKLPPFFTLGRPLSAVSLQTAGSPNVDTALVPGASRAGDFQSAARERKRKRSPRFPVALAKAPHDLPDGVVGGGGLPQIPDSKNFYSFLVQVDPLLAHNWLPEQNGRRQGPAARRHILVGERK